MSYTCALSLKKIKDYLAGAAVVGFDFETSPIEEYRSEERAALDAHKAAITGVSLSVSEDSGIYIPLRHRAGRNIQRPEAVMDYLRQAVFENATVIKVAHNLAFESMFLYALGVIVQPPCYDTIAAAQLTLKSSTTFRSLSDSGLKTLVPQLFHVELPDFETVTAGRFFDELDPQDKETVRYACADSDFALRLYHLFNGWFDQYLPRHRRIVEQLESPTAVYCGLMRYNGLLMDQAAMEEKQAEAEQRLSAIREEIAFLIGDVEIGANASTSAFKSYLYKDLGLPVVKTTAKYQEAADDETMILLADWCGRTARSLPGSLSWCRNTGAGEKSKAPIWTAICGISTTPPGGYIPISCRWERKRAALPPAIPTCRTARARITTPSASAP